MTMRLAIADSEDSRDATGVVRQVAGLADFLTGANRPLRSVLHPLVLPLPRAGAFGGGQADPYLVPLNSGRASAVIDCFPVHLAPSPWLGLVVVTSTTPSGRDSKLSETMERWTGLVAVTHFDLSKCGFAQAWWWVGSSRWRRCGVQRGAVVSSSWKPGQQAQPHPPQQLRPPQPHKQQRSRRRRDFGAGGGPSCRIPVMWHLVGGGGFGLIFFSHHIFVPPSSLPPTRAEVHWSWPLPWPPGALRVHAHGMPHR